VAQAVTNGLVLAPAIRFGTGGVSALDVTLIAYCLVNGGLALLIGGRRTAMSAGHRLGRMPAGRRWA
jgi:hypothetical protein